MTLLLFLFSLIALIVALVSRSRVTTLEGDLEILRREFGDLQRRFSLLMKKETLTEPETSEVKQKVAVVPEVEQEVGAESVPEKPLQAVDAKSENSELPPVVVAKSRPPESKVVTPAEPDIVQRFFSKLSEWVKTYGPQFQEGEPKEVVLMRWWLPRLGGALALLTLLFLGLYMSRYSSPWMRACELIGASLGFCAVGLFFERRRKSFGGVLFVTGLVMLYLTSFAIYAFPAVRIIQNPIVGAAIQFITMALICGVGLIRQKNSLTFLAYVFGVFVILFMQYEMLPGGALFMSLVLAASAFILWGIHKHLSFLAWIAQFVLLITQVGTLGFFFIRAQIAPDYLCFISALSASLLVPLLSQFVFFREIPGKKYFVPFCKASGAALGYCLIRYMCPDLMIIYYGVLALSFIGLGVLSFRKDGFKESTQWYLIMGSLFGALWVVNYFTGDIRWYALILESLAIAAIYRKHPCWVNACVMYALWICSTVIFCSSFFGSQGSETWFAVWIYIYLLYPVFQIIVPMVAYGRNPTHKVRAGIISGLIGVLSSTFYCSIFGEILPLHANTDVFWMIGSAYLFGAFTLIPRLNRTAPIAASISLYICSLIMHTVDFAYDLALVPIWGWAILAVYANLKSQKPLKRWSFAAYGSCIFVTAYTLITYHFVDANSLMFSMVLALICLGLSRLKLFKPLGFLSLIFPLLSIAKFADVFINRPHLELLGLGCHMGAIVLMLLWLLLAKSKTFTEILSSSVGKTLPEKWVIFPSLLLCSLYYLTPMDWPHWWILQVFTLASLAFFAFYSERNQDRLMLVPFYLVALLQVISSMTYTWFNDLFYVVPGSHFFVFELLFAALYFSYGIWVGKSQKWESCDARIYQGALAVCAYVVGTAIIFYPTLPLSGVYTPLLGALSVLFVVVGVFSKIRYYRLLGLMTLFIPGYRLFAYDITDALYRIVAFGVGALMLIFIGYLYHRMVVSDGDETE